MLLLTYQFENKKKQCFGIWNAHLWKNLKFNEQLSMRGLEPDMPSPMVRSLTTTPLPHAWLT